MKEEYRETLTDELLPALTDESSDDLVKRMQDRVEASAVLAQALRAATIKQTLPSDWVILGGKAYLMCIGVERLKPWRIKVERPDIESENLPDGHVAYTATLAAESEMTGERTIALGMRSSADKFFAPQWREATNEQKVALRANIKAAALTRAIGVAYRRLTGMNGLPDHVLQEHGLDTSKITRVEYRDRKGEATQGPSEPGAISDGKRKALYALARKKVDADWKQTEPLMKRLQKACDDSRASNAIKWLDSKDKVTLAQYAQLVEHAEKAAAGAEPAPAPEAPAPAEEG
jgi:hypothetical protein